VHWGFALEYSTLYLTERFTGGPPKQEPLNQWMPLVEFSFDSLWARRRQVQPIRDFPTSLSPCDSPLRQLSRSTEKAGDGVGFRAQLLFFLDEVSPTLFGKPLFSSQPVVSRVEKFSN
jgi:hypothetical protein